MIKYFHSNRRVNNSSYQLRIYSNHNNHQCKHNNQAPLYQIKECSNNNHQCKHNNQAPLYQIKECSNNSNQCKHNNLQLCEKVFLFDSIWSTCLGVAPIDSSKSM